MQNRIHWIPMGTVVRLEDGRVGWVKSPSHIVQADGGAIPVSGDTEVHILITPQELAHLYMENFDVPSIPTTSPMPKPQLLAVDIPDYSVIRVSGGSLAYLDHAENAAWFTESDCTSFHPYSDLFTVVKDPYALAVDRLGLMAEVERVRNAFFTHQVKDVPPLSIVRPVGLAGTALIQIHSIVTSTLSIVRPVGLAGTVVGILDRAKRYIETIEGAKITAVPGMKVELVVTPKELAVDYLAGQTDPGLQKRRARIARCTICGERMCVSSCASNSHVHYADGATLPAIPYDDEAPCHDCNVQRGGFHHPGCDQERCPRCGGQRISCECHEADA